MKKITITALALSGALISSTATADTILGIYAGAQMWDMGSDGSFGNNVDQQASFNFKDDSQASFYLALEHPVPLVPNIKVRSNELETSGVTQLTTTFTFDNEVFSVDTALDTNVDLSHTDFIFYYEVFDNDLISIDLGLNAKHFDGELSVVEQASPSRNAREEFDGWVPMFYGAIKVGIPATALNLYADGSFLSIDDHTIYDYQAGIAYEIIDNPALDITLQLGYRVTNLDLEDLDDIYSNLEFDGAYLGIEAHF
ncbi:TIGR04219 family outer membrane beta-barrel protein [Flocculibacter collagenilyticus]|uniref:TIGR04219 family outer membrane beta-barrel protein n=1 Tax=Flocculibacter collagenilyticus TaxID=2744479 RepID=UPI0018F307F1|nr:TIGR04219 family outer membrane beta-barrel protein [Flocculibacter collagenilyticus]